MINCPKCNTHNPDGAKFCKACRSPIPKTTEKIRCSNGHIMDPTWKICPICQAGAGDGRKKIGVSHQKTQVENATLQGSGSARRKTKIEDHILERGPVGSKRAKRKTVVISTNKSHGKDDSAVRPRIVGFLITYSNDPSGEYFEIKEGRHVIGAGAETDITLKGDKNISSEHSILLFRRGLFLMRDNLSTNGTFVNGEEIAGDVSLNNYDKIKMGDTQFTFIIIEPPNENAQ